MPKRALTIGLAALVSSCAVLVLAGGLGLGQKTSDGAGSAPAVVPSLTAAAASIRTSDLGKVPVYFVPNAGQTDSRVGFYVQGADKTVYFSPDGVTFALKYPARAADPREGARWVVKLEFVGARKDVQPEGLEKTGASISYFKGKPEEWLSGLPAYSRIIYRDLWPGIDLVYNGGRDKLKYEFVVHPGADPSRIKLAYRGAEHLALTRDGRLEVGTPAGGFEDDSPVAHQEIEGRPTGVPVAYLLEDAGPEIPHGPGHGGRTGVYGFALGEYDRSRPLLIDPTLLIYCGYIGGSDEDAAFGIAVDASGNVYVTGLTYSVEPTFPVSVGPDLAQNGDADAFVAKVNSSGTSLIYCGYIGGSGADICGGIAVDAAGNAYVAGSTDSSEATFPVKVGPDLTYNGGDSFVAKVNPSGTELVYCGYIGATGFVSYNFGNWPADIAVDSAGYAYVTGSTNHPESSFPVKVGPDLTYNGGDYDVYVAKVNPSGSDLVYCGYVGGSDRDSGGDIAVDPLGNVYIAGETRSTGSTFPVKVGPDLTFNGGGQHSGDAFVAKIGPSGSDLVYCGYVGGSSNEMMPRIAVDDGGNLYLAGQTGSTQSTFPVKVGPDLTFNSGSGGDYDNDGFVAKVNSSGAGLDYCGYIGGSGEDTCTGIDVDGEGNAYVAGYTQSTEATFPVTDGPDLTHNGGDDAFVAKISPSGTALVYCGYIGGSGGDGTAWSGGGAIAIDGSGNAYIVGETWSSEATFPVLIGPDLTFNGTRDAFVAKVGDIPGPPVTSLVPDSADAGNPGLLLSVYGSDFVDGAVVRWDGSARPTTFISSSELQAAIDAPDLVAGRVVSITVRNPNGGISSSLAFTINNPVPTLASLSTTHVTGGGAAFTLTVQGSNFVPNSVVRWNGGGRTTTYVSSTELQAAIPASDLTTGGDIPVTVFNPAPAGGTTSALTLQVSGYTAAATPTSVTVTAGQSAAYTISVTPQYGSFDSAVTFSCTGLPSKCAATFSPTSVTPGAAAATTTLTLATQASAAATAAALSGTTAILPPASVLALLVLGLVLAPRLSLFGRRSSRRWAAAGALLVLAILIGGCSSGGGDNDPPPYTGTPKGTHTITINAVSGTMTVPVTITLIVN